MSDPGEPPGPLDLSPGDGGERGPPISVAEGRTVGGPPPSPKTCPSHESWPCLCDREVKVPATACLGRVLPDQSRIPGSPVEIAHVLKIGNYFGICISKSKWQVEKKAT